MPLAGLEVDDALVAPSLSAARALRELADGPPPQRRHVQRGAQDIRYKTRKYQQDSTNHGGDAGGFQADRANPVAGKGVTDADEVGASGFSQQQHAQDRGGDKKGSGPQPADHRGHQDECQELRRRQRGKPDKGPFNQRHRARFPASVLSVSHVGATVGIVYGPACEDLRRWFGASPWISAVACLHIGTGTDVCLRRFCICRHSTDPAVPSRLPRACETCSISTPSSFWRWQCSSSCACEACWVNAPGASGRPMIPMPPATPCAARPTTTW